MTIHAIMVCCAMLTVGTSHRLMISCLRMRYQLKDAIWLLSLGDMEERPLAVIYYQHANNLV